VNASARNAARNASSAAREAAATMVRQAEKQIAAEQ
jgi:hypothetical protein